MRRVMAMAAVAAAFAAFANDEEDKTASAAEEAPVAQLEIAPDAQPGPGAEPEGRPKPPFDLKLETRPMTPGAYDSAWELRVDAGRNVESSVYTIDGNLIAGPYLIDRFHVPGARAWSAETPRCYRVVAKASDGSSAERVFGFVERRIKDGRLYVNGRPVRVKLGPKHLNGNAVVLPRDATPEVSEAAFLDGVYALSGAELVQVSHEVATGSPGLTRHLFRDWTVSATNYFGRVVIRNLNSFLDSTDVELKWTLLVDGREEDDGEIGLMGLKPRCAAVRDMPEEVVKARLSGGTVSVRFSFLRDGEEIARDQVDIVQGRCLEPLQSEGGGAVKLDEEMDRLVFRTGGMMSRGIRWVYDRATGFPVALTHRGVVWDTKVLKGVFPVMEGLGVAENLTAKFVSQVDERDGALSVSSLSKCVFAPPYKPESSYRSEVAAVWTVYGSGVMACRAKTRAVVNARAGFAFELVSPGDVEWFGPGPFNTFRNVSKEGAFLGRWRRTPADGPVRVESATGVRYGGLTVRTLGAPFAFAVETTEEGRIFLCVYSSEKEGEISFTLSVGDRDLTARVPDVTRALPRFGSK